MSEQCLEIASNIIANIQAGTRADVALRKAFSGPRAEPRSMRRDVSLAVFDYFRWHGLLERQKPLRTRIRQATALARKFRESPQSFDTNQLRQLVPVWLDDWMGVTDEWIRSLQATPTVWIRCRRGEDATVAASLDVERPTGPTPGPGCFAYQGDRDLFQSAEFKRGAFEIQDLNSQWVGAFCDPKPGETWWDVCAGEGGKFLDLADRMENRGLVWVTDRSGSRLKRLRQRAARADVFNYRWRQADLAAGAPFKVMFDGVLVDAPCSGIGTWQRNPDARWTLVQEDIVELSECQKAIVRRAAAQVKPGGRLLYAVCTLASKETVEVADWFDREFGDFEPMPLSEGEIPTTADWPCHESRSWLGVSRGTGNGMFVAAWRRVADGAGGSDV